MEKGSQMEEALPWCLVCAEPGHYTRFCHIQGEVVLPPAKRKEDEELLVPEVSEGGAACLSARGGGQLGNLPQRSQGLKLVPHLRGVGALCV
ncbi:hypothetical protein EOD39_12642 [Acipenser ruthenus]|uniref:Uncharacterized protein n=1 Tax=Acipenser ruthenus TaxID=7906 RepID=A0A444UKM5_ACIRT|nr:hypothetical protein EOD39_12642 [Acipenser ruthenus]